MYYNNYNNKLSIDLDKMLKSFNSNLLDMYLDLLNIIYKIYFNENIFQIVNDSIKYKLNISLNLLIKNNNWFYTYDDKDEKINLINLIISINNTINFNSGFEINNALKTTVEKVLLTKNMITNKDIINHTNIFKLVRDFQDNQAIINFFKIYNIDIENDQILKIKDTIIPNFYLLKKNVMVDHYYEFCHLLFKIYAPILYYGVSFQEGYEYNINSQDTVFDCGGNMGLFALYCASKGAKVYCFEPMSYIRDLLQESQKQYPDLIHIIPCGVSDKEDIQYFHQTYNPGAGTNTQFPELDYTSERLYKERCKIITLDSFSKMNNIYPTFIKADIEGSETQMLNGAKTILSTYKPIMHIALNHRDEDQFKVPNLIYQLNNNYQFFKILEGDINSQFILCK